METKPQLLIREWSTNPPTTEGLWLYCALITNPNFTTYYANPRVYKVFMRNDKLVAKVNHHDTRPVANLNGAWMPLPKKPRPPK